jgi:AAA domain
MAKESQEQYLEVERKVINLMLRFPEVVQELKGGINPEFFHLDHKPLVQAIFYVGGLSEGKRLLTDDHYRTLLVDQGVKGDITVAMQVYHSCMYGVPHSNTKEDLDLLVKDLKEAYTHREGVEALHRMNENVQKLGYLEATRIYADELAQICGATSPGINISPTSMDDLYEDDLLRKWIWYGMIAKGCVSLLAAKRKGGKTTLMTEFIKMSNAGGRLIGEIMPTKILYVTEETKLDWKVRLDSHEIPKSEHIDWLFIRDDLNLISPTWQKWDSLGRKICEQIDAKGYELVVFDTISKMTPLEDERDAMGWHRVYRTVWEITAKNVGVLLVHHCRKTEGSDPLDLVRGSGVICDNADNIMVLSLPKMGSETERVLDVWGRFESPAQFSLDFNKETSQYFLVNTSDHKKQSEAIQAIDRLLNNGQKTSTQIVEVLKHSISRAYIMRLLLKGVELGFWVREGKGTKGSPHIYKKHSSTTQTQDTELKTANTFTIL